MYTFTKEDGSQKKTVYHSEWVRRGPLWVSFKSDPRESTYSGRPPYVYMTITGDNGQPEEPDYQYQVENPAIESWIRGLPKNTWLYIEATGSREEAALSSVDGSAGSSGTAVPGSNPPKQPAPPAGSLGQGLATAPPPPAGGKEPLSHDTWHALEAAHEVVDFYVKKYGREPSDAVLRIAAGLVIEHHRSGRPIGKDA